MKDIASFITSIEDQVQGIVIHKLNDFNTWLPAIRKRSESENEVGPDFDAVSRQIEEMKVIENEVYQLSFSGLLDDSRMSCILREEDKEKLVNANEEWMIIKTWVDRRLETLSKTNNLWDAFKIREKDLMDYLHGIDKNLNAKGVNLKDDISVNARIEVFQGVTLRMENEKCYVSNLVEISDQLIEMINEESGIESSFLVSGILSKISDILDLWNTFVKRSIELKTNLQASCRKVKTLERLHVEVEKWLKDATDILNQFDVDESGEFIEELLELLEEKQNEQEDSKIILSRLNQIDGELLKNNELSFLYTLKGRTSKINKEFNSVSSQLQELRKLPGKARILSRQIRGGTRRLFTQC